MKYSIRTILLVTTILFLGMIVVYQNRHVANIESTLARHGIAKKLSPSTPLETQDGTNMHPFGVAVELVTVETDAHYYTHGLRVNQLKPNGPAFHAGIFEGDIIVGMAGWKTESPDALDFIVNAKMNGYQPANTYFVQRNGQLHQGAIQW